MSRYTISYTVNGEEHFSSKYYNIEIAKEVKSLYKNKNLHNVKLIDLEKNEVIE